METFKPKPLEERKSQNLKFWDFTKDKLFWAALPFVTGGTALLFGMATKFKVFPLDGSPDLLTHAWAKGAELIAKKGGAKEGSAIHGALKDVHSGKMVENVIEEMFGLPSGEKLRKMYYNFAKGAEVALPFLAYFLWHKSEANRLQLSEVDEKLRSLKGLRPSDADLTLQNDVMRKELAFAAQQPAGSPENKTADTAWQQRVGAPQEPTPLLKPRTESYADAVTSNKAASKIAVGA